MKAKAQLTVTRRFPFSVERVFDAWLDPARAAKWLFATPDGAMIRAETDPRVGGRYVFVDRRGSEEVEHTGEYLEIERPRKLVFTFGVPKFSPDYEVVTIHIAEVEGGCDLSLSHETGAEFASRSRLGWTWMVERLAVTLGDTRAVANQTRGQFTAPGEVRIERLLPGPMERVWEYLTNDEKRGKWFAGGPMELRAGGAYELFFRHSRLSPTEEPPEKYKEVHYTGVKSVGTVIECEPPRLLAYTWEGDSPETNSEVRFELESVGDEVRLVLTHRKLACMQEKLNVSSGWHLHIAILDALLSHNTPPPFWAAFAQLHTEYEKLSGDSGGN